MKDAYNTSENLNAIFVPINQYSYRNFIISLWLFMGGVLKIPLYVRNLKLVFEIQKIPSQPPTSKIHFF